MFPGTVLPLTVSRPASIKLLDDTLPLTKVIGLLTQRDEANEEPRPQDLYHVGTAALVLKLLRQSDERIVMIVQGMRRFALRKIVATEPFLRAEVDLAGIDLAAARQRMAGGISKPARQRGAPARTDAGRAGAGGDGRAQHR